MWYNEWTRDGKDGIPALLADRAPVVGCVYECSDDNLPASPGIFGGLPVVYLHASSARRNDRIVFTLLRDTKTPISAVAALCGWRSDIALRWLFRRRTGMSMRQWRRENT